MSIYGSGLYLQPEIFPSRFLSLNCSTRLSILSSPVLQQFDLADEIGRVVVAFNDFQARQAAYEQQLKTANEELEFEVTTLAGGMDLELPTADAVP